MKSIDSLNKSFKPSKLAPERAGIESKNDILLESTLLNFKILAAVIVIPALLTPGIRESIWKKLIKKIVWKFKFVEIFLSKRLWSAIYKIIPNIKVVQAITLMFLML